MSQKAIFLIGAGVFSSLLLAAFMFVPIMFQFGTGYNSSLYLLFPVAAFFIGAFIFDSARRVIKGRKKETASPTRSVIEMAFLAIVASYVVHFGIDYLVFHNGEPIIIQGVLDGQELHPYFLLFGIGLCLLNVGMTYIQTKKIRKSTRNPAPGFWVLTGCVFLVFGTNLGILILAT